MRTCIGDEAVNSSLTHVPFIAQIARSVSHLVNESIILDIRDPLSCLLFGNSD